MGLLGRLAGPAVDRLTAPARNAMPDLGVDDFLGVLVRRRRVWSGSGRAHVELRALDADAMVAFADALTARLVAHPAVQWAQVFPPLGRVVAAYDPTIAPLDELVGTVEEVEAELGQHEVPFPDEVAGHPADGEPLAAGLVALGAEVLAVGVGAVGRVVRFLPLHRLTPFAVLTALVEGTPRLRGLLAPLVGRQVADLGASVANAFVQGFTQGPVGPLVNVTHRCGQVAESAARHRVWVDREPELHGKPPQHPPAHRPGRPRPAPLPAGVVERHAARALPGSLAAAVVGLALPDRLERASAALYGGLPKAALLGRDAFAAQLGRALSGRGVVVLTPGVLRVIDRVDHAVVDGALLAG